MMTTEEREEVLRVAAARLKKWHDAFGSRGITAMSTEERDAKNLIEMVHLHDQELVDLRERLIKKVLEFSPPLSEVWRAGDVLTQRMRRVPIRKRVKKRKARKSRV